MAVYNNLHKYADVFDKTLKNVLKFYEKLVRFLVEKCMQYTTRFTIIYC